MGYEMLEQELEKLRNDGYEYAASFIESLMKQANKVSELNQAQEELISQLLEERELLKSVAISSYDIAKKAVAIIDKI